MKKIRKKITAIVMAFSMVSALAACGGNDSPKDTGTEKTTDTGNGEVTLSLQSWNPNDTTFAPAKDAWDELDTGIEIHFESLPASGHDKGQRPGASGVGGYSVHPQ